MKGMAKELFYSIQGRTPWKLTSNKITKSSWKRLQELVNDQILDDIDIYLAEKLLANNPFSCEEIAALVCYLSLACRQGHLCVKVTSSSITPALQNLVQQSLIEKIGMAITDLKISQWQRLILQGVSLLNSEKTLEAFSSFLHLMINDQSQFFYFKNQWIQESGCLDYWVSLSRASPTIKLDESKVKTLLQHLLDGKYLLKEQACAILTACFSCTTLLSGGPGTGKTYTAGWLIKVIWEVMTAEQKKQFKIAIAAPTGKAAANLSSSIKKVMGNLTDLPELTPRTLHSLLGMGSKKESNLLSFDLILVDECSMVDITLMLTLLKSVKEGSRLILIGDKSQLSPIEPGAFFADLMTLDLVSKVELKVCLRSEAQEIILLADSVKNGNDLRALALLSKEGTLSLWPKENVSPKVLQEMILKRIEDLKIFELNQETDPNIILKAFGKFRLLSPLRNGALGVDALNNVIAHLAYSKVKKNEKYVIPILINANDYHLNLFNGEVGIVVKKSNTSHPLSFKIGDVAYFISPEGTLRQFPAQMLSKVELAYCLSVHKSQGSEFENVIIVLPEESKIFGRELLYTAVTRGKKKVDIVANQETIVTMINNSLTRMSGVCVRLPVHPSLCKFSHSATLSLLPK